MVKKIQVPVIGGLRKTVTIPDAALATTIAGFAGQTLTIDQLKALLGTGSTSTNNQTGPSGSPVAIIAGTGLAGGGPLVGAVQIRLAAPVPAMLYDDAQDGEPGPPGPQGPRGFAGAPGVPGAPGEDGADGDVGPPGIAGVAGAQGARGPMGPPGNDGEDGIDGLLGPPGATGPAGAPGATGASGPPGADGADGEDGTQGPPGNPGPQGSAGPQGTQGPAIYLEAEALDGEQGPPGPAGQNGAPGPQGTQGPAIYLEVEALDGEQGPPGPAGQNGAPGPQGTQGPAVLFLADDAGDYANDGPLGYPQQIGLPAGADTQVQFNRAGVLGGDPAFTYNYTNDALALVNTSGVAFTLTPSAGNFGFKQLSANATWGVRTDESTSGYQLTHGMDDTGVYLQTNTASRTFRWLPNGVRAMQITGNRNVTIDAPVSGTAFDVTALASTPAITWGASGAYSAAAINRGGVYYDTAGGIATFFARSSGGSTQINLNVSNAGTDTNAINIGSSGATTISADWGANQGLTLRNLSATDGRTIMRFINNLTTSQTYDFGIDTSGGTTKGFGLRDITNARFPWTVSVAGSHTFAAPSSGGTMTVQSLTGQNSLVTGVASATNNPRLFVSHVEATGTTDVNFTVSTGAAVGTLSCGGTLIATLGSAGSCAFAVSTSVPKLALTGAVTATNGFYLPAAATVGVCTNGVQVGLWDTNGVLYTAQPTPAAVNATATLTIANLLTLIITSTTVAAVTGTLPTGTLTDAGIAGGTAAVNISFDWSVINTGPSTFTVAAGTSHTIVGTATVAAGTSARFRTRKTAANTFVTYRLAQ